MFDRFFGTLVPDFERHHPSAPESGPYLNLTIMRVAPSGHFVWWGGTNHSDKYIKSGASL